jgi:hypothetical protein
MKNYVLTYHSNQTTPPDPEALEKWNGWFETLGDKLVDGGNPITGVRMVLKDGNVEEEKNDLIGYSIIKAANLDEALTIVKTNPLATAKGGAVRVYETGQM